MKNNWPTTVEELIEECEMLEGRHDLYTLGEKGEPFQGESEPRVDGTRYLAGEYQYGVAMIPAQWVTHVLSAHTESDAVTMGVGTCELINAADDLGKGTSSFMCFECGYTALDDWWDEFNYCPQCGARIIKETIE